MTPLHEQVSQAERDDLRTRAGLLIIVLAEHPSILTLRDVLLEMDDDQDDVSEAARDLVAAGLLRREGESVLPTRAALVYDRLPL